MVTESIPWMFVLLVSLAGPLLAIWLVWSVHRIRLTLETIAAELRRPEGPREPE